MYCFLKDCSIVYEIENMRLIKLEHEILNDLANSNRSVTKTKELAKLTLIPVKNKVPGYKKAIVRSVSELELISIVGLLKAEQNKDLHVIQHTNTFN